MKLLIINCDDFENAPRDLVEEYDNDKELNKRIDDIENELARNKYSYYRGWSVAETIPFKRTKAEKAGN